MARLDRSLTLQLLLQVLRPAIRFAVRHSVRLQDFIECSKAVFIDEAKRELAVPGEKTNVSKISAMTGVHRRDVMRLQDEGIETAGERDLIRKIIGQWRNDRRFTTKSGEPRTLGYGGSDSEFGKLVASVSGDLNPGTVFYELCRVEAIKVTRQGVKLLVESFVPKADPIGGFHIYAEDGEDLLSAVDENVLAGVDPPHFHARTVYDNIRPAAMDRIRRWMLSEGHKFHARVRAYLSKHDQDITPDPKFTGKGARVVFSSFSLTQNSKGKK